MFNSYTGRHSKSTHINVLTWCIGIQGYTEVNAGIHWYAQVYMSIHGYTQVNAGTCIHGYTCLTAKLGDPVVKSTTSASRLHFL